MEQKIRRDRNMGDNLRRLRQSNIENYRVLTDSLSKAIAPSVAISEIASLQQSLLHNDFTGLQAFANSLKTSRIEAPNLALLKLSPLFSEIDIPRGPNFLPNTIRR